MSSIIKRERKSHQGKLWVEKSKLVNLTTQIFYSLNIWDTWKLLKKNGQEKFLIFRWYLKFFKFNFDKISDKILWFYFFFPNLSSNQNKIIYIEKFKPSSKITPPHKKSSSKDTQFNVNWKVVMANIIPTYSF
jgi:hypothetical protein